jgi:hypothetical protein
LEIVSWWPRSCATPLGLSLASGRTIHSDLPSFAGRVGLGVTWRLPSINLESIAAFARGVTCNAFCEAKWWLIDPDLLLISAASWPAVAPKEDKDMPVINQVVAETRLTMAITSARVTRLTRGLGADRWPRHNS